MTLLISLKILANCLSFKPLLKTRFMKDLKMCDEGHEVGHNIRNKVKSVFVE